MLKQISRSNILWILFISLIFTEVTAKPRVKKIQLSTPTSLVVDLKTGKILHEKNANTRVYPASLVKLMTSYLAFESIESGKLLMNQRLRVSERAEKMKPTKLGLLKGEYITVRDATLGVTIKSANDAAVVLAENIARSEVAFVGLMNSRAKQLGMKDTKFKNASGWHDPEQKTTARDVAKLAIALKRDFPRFYPIFSKTSFVFRGNVVEGHNNVTANYDGAEGLKTGYTIPSGYNLVTVASKNNKTLVGVVTGCATASSRDQTMVKLLEENFVKHQHKRTKYTKNEPNSYMKNKST